MSRTVVHGVDITLNPPPGAVAGGTVLQLRGESSSRALLKSALGHHPRATLLYDGSTTAGAATADVSGELSLGKV